MKGKKKKFKKGDYKRIQSNILVALFAKCLVYFKHSINNNDHFPTVMDTTALHLYSLLT